MEASDDGFLGSPATVADLTPRQLAVAALVAQGRSDKAIAMTLGISERRVRVHVAAIAYLCQFDPERNTRIQLALWYRSTNVVPIPGDPHREERARRILEANG